MQNLPLRKIAIFTSIFILLAIILAIFVWVWQHGRLVLTLPDEAHRVIVTKQSNGEEVINAEVDNTHFEQVLASDSYVVNVSNEEGRKESAYFLQVPNFLGTTTKEVQLYNQSQREKIGQGSLPCPVLEGSTLYSYTCSGASSIERAVNGVTITRSNASVSFDEIVTAKSYRNGLLVLHLKTYQDEELIIPELSFVENGRITSTKSLPHALRSSLTGSVSYELEIDNDESFVITSNHTQNVFLFNDYEAAPVQLDTSIQTGPFPIESLINSVTFRDDTLTILSGSPDVGHEADDGITVDQSLFINQFSITDGQIGDTRHETIPNVAMEQATLCATQHVCVTQRDNTLLYEIGITTPKAIIPGANNNAIHKDANHLAYMQNNKIFVLNTQTLEARQIYYSPNFRISNIFPSPEGILINAFIEKDGADSNLDLYTFITNGDPSENNTFIDQKLPYPQGSIDGAVLRSDYYRNLIFVQVALESWRSPVRVSGGGASDYTFDEAEFNEKRQRILEQLEHDGFTEPEYDIRIEP